MTDIIPEQKPLTKPNDKNAQETECAANAFCKDYMSFSMNMKLVYHDNDKATAPSKELVQAAAADALRSQAYKEYTTEDVYQNMITPDKRHKLEDRLRVATNESLQKLGFKSVQIDGIQLTKLSLPNEIVEDIWKKERTKASPKEARKER